MHKIVDSASNGINSCKSQHERAIGSVKRARHIRNIQLKELAEHVKKCGETDVRVSDDFN